ncbi:hypothetical protein [Haladaptatus sp. DYSN1]|uniref:hypothetical protein n=1 Tax=unclassified Haladaptatus TaxID=2622732 RepID=UPI002406699D|nr:hypothetical protein [Haladaptatus sp. DYSN1]
MARTGKLGSVVEDASLNAVLSWFLVGFVLVVIGESLLGGDLLWAVFALGVAVLALIPAISYRNPRAMLPWEVLVLAVLPMLGRAFSTIPVTGELATYLSVAALALIVAVELHVFTPVQMTHGFAVLFVVIATMAAAGVWAVTRWVADLYLGTGFILNEEALMWEFVWSTAAGVLAGIIFDLYFRRRAPIEVRLPEGLGGMGK